MRLCSLLAIALALALLAPAAYSQETGFAVADGKLSFQAPKSWEKTKPASRIVEVEYKVAPAKGDEQAGRFTVMGAGGTVDANIDRWIGQFTQPDKSDTRKSAKIDKISVGGCEVHYVDIAGDYKDQPGPFTPAVNRENYRMLAAIIVTKNDQVGNYYLKFYGPKATVTENEKQFREMLDSLKLK